MNHREVAHTTWHLRLVCELHESKRNAMAYAASSNGILTTGMPGRRRTADTLPMEHIAHVHGNLPCRDHYSADLS